MDRHLLWTDPHAHDGFTDHSDHWPTWRDLDPPARLSASDVLGIALFYLLMGVLIVGPWL